MSLFLLLLRNFISGLFDFMFLFKFVLFFFIFYFFLFFSLLEKSRFEESGRREISKRIPYNGQNRKKNVSKQIFDFCLFHEEQVPF